MHQRIVKQLTQIIEERFSEEEIQIYVSSKETGGFWSMAVMLKVRSSINFAHGIEQVAMNVGRLFGEGLSVNTFTVSRESSEEPQLIILIS